MFDCSFASLRTFENAAFYYSHLFVRLRLVWKCSTRRKIVIIGCQSSPNSAHVSELILRCILVFENLTLKLKFECSHACRSLDLVGPCTLAELLLLLIFN